MTVIVDYGMGNLGSVLNMLKRAGDEAIISGERQAVERATRLILPGVGAFDNGIGNLEARQLIPVLNKKVLQERTPILGICLGLQLFSSGSEEGKLPGLGWIEAETRRFRLEDSSPPLAIPHMGWNEVTPRERTGLFRELPHPPRFYFVHSYHLCCRNQKDVVGTSTYGYEFPAAVAVQNIMGTQFHPEKSHKYGLQLMRNFLALTF